MLNSNRWSIAERYMVRYHMSHLAWWAISALCVPLVSAVLVFALIQAGVLPYRGDFPVFWAISAGTTLLLTAIGLYLKTFLVRAITVDWELRHAVVRFKRAAIAALTLWGVAALLPIAVYGFTGSLSYFLLVVPIPILVTILNFPHSERFTLFAQRFFDATEPEKSPEAELGP